MGIEISMRTLVQKGDFFWVGDWTGEKNSSFVVLSQVKIDVL